MGGSSCSLNRRMGQRDLLRRKEVHSRWCGWISVYWRDLRKEKQQCISRQDCGRSVMIWAAFSSKGKSSLACLDGIQDPFAYCTNLRKYLLRYANCYYGVIFQFYARWGGINAQITYIIFVVQSFRNQFTALALTFYSSESDWNRLRPPGAFCLRNWETVHVSRHFNCSDIAVLEWNHILVL